ncbi:hypothetical protein LEP48_18035 [Isoptericola sp. NEAU-Y5]|uniref:Transmembrane protein n=1 Tax=Isoptericola luteus TaxID=2879484 RepID=A0ABS7ZIM2_9MICO|nr:DUF6766 family protein [Isoptericola sp. NEAU-Y5]MCA5894857.1 hypothetical protein [Isoptericola sp. NEAU-Y5]MCA5895233.1 hypothetical protein [Isoptericola sp. NEAU-Y5]
MRGLPRPLRGSSLSIFFGLFFLLSLAGQAVSGVAVFNADQVAAGLEPVTAGRYVTSSAFWVDVTENWQSEFLQFLLFITATVWLVQRGSPESKKVGGAGRESDEEQKVGEHAEPGSPSWAKVRGWRLSVYSRSLSLVMGAIFVASWVAQSAGGAVAFSEEQMRDLQDPAPWAQYLTMPDFWSRTLQNWQSEMLAVLSMVVLSIYLRERGSPESKPVGMAHDTTAVGG